MPSTTFIRLPEIMRRYQLSRTTIYRLISLGQFPAPVKLTGARAVGWPEALLDAWAEAKIAAPADAAIAQSAGERWQ